MVICFWQLAGISQISGWVSWILGLEAQEHLTRQGTESTTVKDAVVAAARLGEEGEGEVTTGGGLYSRRMLLALIFILDCCTLWRPQVLAEIEKYSVTNVLVIDSSVGWVRR